MFYRNYLWKSSVLSPYPNLYSSIWLKYQTGHGILVNFLAYLKNKTQNQPVFPKWKTCSSSWILLTFDIYLTEIHKGISKGTWRKIIYLKPYWDDWKGDSITALAFFSSQGFSSNISTIIHTNTSFSLSISLQRHHPFSDGLYYTAHVSKERLG